MVLPEVMQDDRAHRQRGHNPDLGHDVECNILELWAHPYQKRSPGNAVPAAAVMVGGTLNP
jgi:hypothetical protein